MNAPHVLTPLAGNGSRSLGGVLGDIATRVESVARGEVQLAVAKAQHELLRVVGASVRGIVAGMFAVAALALFNAAAIALLSEHMRNWYALSIVAACNLAIALALVPWSRGHKTSRGTSLVGLSPVEGTTMQGARPT